MLEFALFVIYLILFSWLVTKTSFFSRSGLTKTQLVFFFLLKVAAGIFYGWIGIYYGQYAKMADTWNYHTESLKEYSLLFNHPGEYFTNLFYNPYHDGMIRFFDSSDSYWNDLKSNVIIKLLSLFNIFSLGNYFVNVIFYSFLTFYGPVSFFKVMYHIFPGQKTQVMLATFLVPSFLYWTSGIHKDGLIFLGLGFIIYNIYFSFSNGGLKPIRLLYIVLGFGVILPMRNYIIFILVPALLSWIISNLRPKRRFLIFGLTYLISGLLFFSTSFMPPQINLPMAVVNKQTEFMKAEGRSSLPLDNLEPNFFSFAANMPRAFNHAIIRPYPSDAQSILALAAVVEIVGLMLLFILFLFFRRKDIQMNNFILFSLAFSFSLLLIIGYTVQFMGAIVRYRSVVFPLLVVPMVCYTDWKRLGELIFFDIKNKINI